MLSTSRTNIPSAVVEENADFIPLDMSDVKTVIEEVAQDERKREETHGSEEAPPSAGGRELLYRSLVKLQQGDRAAPA